MKKLFILLKILLMIVSIGAEGEDVQIVLHHDSLNQLLKHEIKMGEKKIFAMRPEPLHAVYLGLDLVVDHIQVVEITTSQAHYKVHDDKVTVQLHSKLIRSMGQYQATYKTKREGHFQAEFSDIVADFVLDKSLSLTGCTVRIAETNIQMSPTLPQPIVSKLEREILDRIQADTCSVGGQIVHDVRDKLASAVKATDISGGSNPSSFSHAVRFDDTVSDTEAVDVVVSADVVNREFVKLFESANTKFFWSDLPEIRRLFRQCPDGVDCSVFLIGDLHSALNGPPKLTIGEGSATASIPLTTTLTYGQRVIMSVDTELVVDLLSLDVTGPKHGMLTWKPEYKVVEIKVSRFYSSKRLHWLKAELEQILNGVLLGDIEKLLDEYIEGSLPIQVHGLSWRTSRADFRPNQIVFHLNPHLL